MPQRLSEYNVSIPKLMSSLRDLMTKDRSAVHRIKAILALLCEELSVPTAVLYIMRPGDILEQFVALGKNVKLPTFVRVGEDLVGKVALDRHLVLLHPKSGQYKTLLYLPLVKGNAVVGVLGLLARRNLPFTDEIVEAVENVVMILTEFVQDAGSSGAAKKLTVLSDIRVLDGIGLVSGFALGEVLSHRRLEVSGPILATHAASEKKRLTQAFGKVLRQIKHRLDKISISKEEKDIFETYWLFLNDTDWRSKIIAAINGGLTAEAAVQKVADETLDRMRAITDPYLRERAHDFQDLTARLMLALVQKARSKKLDGNKILVADSLGAAELLDYDLKHIKGIVVEDGSKTSHVVIVARAYHIPLIGGVQGATRQLEDGATVALDSARGRVFLRPTDEVLDSLHTRQIADKKLQRLYRQNYDKPCVTKDGKKVRLMVNLGVNAGMEKLPACDGVGLYRTELLFMTAKELPDVSAQTEAYRRVLMMAKNKPVTFRTLDIGSDKVLPYFEQHGEENPAMGWRSIRMVLDRRALLRNQLRALIRAAAGGTLRVMFPMITSVAEFLEAKRTLMLELKRAQSCRERVPVSVQVGTMLEVPALLFQLDQLLDVVDFISIGTNDLAQFVFAADRSNSLISTRYDVLSAPFLSILLKIISACHNKNVDCSVCGEMASKPLEALTLLALGVDCLSVSPDALGAVKTALRALHLKHFCDYLSPNLNSIQPSLREALFSYLRDHCVELGGGIV